MEDFTPQHKPGKTAPRLVRDLLDYDPSRSRSDGQNLLVDPPPIFRKKGKLHPLRMLPQDCCHQLRRKDLQTNVPRVDEQPTSTVKYISASYCARCLYHFDVITDYTRRPGREIPCELGNLHHPMHHLQHCGTWSKKTPEKSGNPNKYENFKEIHTFACSNPGCALVVCIRISPPRLSKERLSSLCDPAKVYRRGHSAISDHPERHQDSRILAPVEVLGVLRTYLSHALNQRPEEKKRIAVRNKRFLLAFADECDDTFEYLDFTLHVEPSANGEGRDKFWVLPELDPVSDDDYGTRSRRNFIEDVIFELSERIAEATPSGLTQSTTRFTFNPLPAANDIYNVLGCLGYLRGSRVVINLEQEHEHEHPHYAGLGAVNDFVDEFIAYAYDCQRECDPENSPYYLECLKGIADGRGSGDLLEKSVIAISMGEHTLEDIENAYKYFAISPDTIDGDEHIIGLYKSRIEAAPRQKEEARQCLSIIGQARHSAVIESVANDRAMSFEEALEYLTVTADTPADSIEAVAISMASDGDRSKVARALRVIGERRKQYSLDFFATSIETGDSNGAMSVNDAYRRLQIGDHTMRDESVISYYQTLMSNAAPGSKVSFTEALGTIAKARNSAFLRAHLDDPNAPIVIEKGSEDEPVGLDNIGNTCYLNSLLQYYYTVKPVRDVVMNFGDYRMALNTTNMLKKRVGGRAVARGEIVKAQKFVEELQNLFENLKTAPTRSVKPSQDLAELTLFSTATEANFRRASISSPAGPSMAPYSDAVVFGPELPPPPPLRPSPIPVVKDDDIEMIDRNSQDLTNQDDSSSDATLVDLDPSTPNDGGTDKIVGSPEKLSAEAMTETNQSEPEYLLISTNESNQEARHMVEIPTKEDKFESQGDEIMTNGPTEEASGLQNGLSSPEKKPPVPPRNKPAPILTSGESEDSLRAQKLYFGAQQDVTEVIGNVMFRLQCAIKPTSIDPKFGEQIDKIRETFYGANAVYLKKAETYDIKIEDWANIIVFPSSDGPRSIYEALDVVFDEQIVEIDNKLTTQYASISKLPPIFQTQIQRTAFDPKTQQASKNQNPILFEEIIYLDRYMDSDKVMQRRKDAWKWKNRIRGLEARQEVLQNKPADLAVPDALDAASAYLRMLEEQEIDGIIVNPTVTEALEERRREILRELDAITEETTTLKLKLQDQFTDMREHRYRLQAVFMHRGTSTYGHYWIYIYDFERDTWREYNDERVSVVNDRQQIFDQASANGATPYYLVYVRDEDKDGLVDAVCRSISAEDADALEADVLAGIPAVTLIDDNDSGDMRQGRTSVTDLLGGFVPAQEQDRIGEGSSVAEFTQMGAWDVRDTNSDRRQQW